MVWIAMDKTMVHFDSIIEAREIAIMMIENNPTKYRNSGVMIFATKDGKPLGIVSYYRTPNSDGKSGRYVYSDYGKVYGAIRRSLNKNGKIIR